MTPRGVIKTARKIHTCSICHEPIEIGEQYKYFYSGPNGSTMAIHINHHEHVNPRVKSIIENSGKITKSIPELQIEINDLVCELCNILEADTTFYQTNSSVDAWSFIRLLNGKIHEAADTVDVAIEKYVRLENAIGRQFGETEKVDYYREQIRKLETWLELLNRLSDACNIDTNLFTNNKPKAKILLQNIIASARQVVEFYI